MDHDVARWVDRHVGAIDLARGVDDHDVAVRARVAAEGAVAEFQGGQISSHEQGILRAVAPEAL